MPMLGPSQAALALTLVLPVVLGQVTHTVTVGVQGSFFVPPTVSAGLNDTVIFVFGGDIHSVTQSSFQTPCIPLEGGFNSGFQGRGPDFSDPTPIWNLVITNISEPIWFFCEASLPTSHCESGMVGAINPPSIESYNQFVSAAKAVTSTPKPTPSFAASGPGAFATSPPMLSSVPLSSLLSSLSFSDPATSTTSTTPLPTNSPTSSAVASRAGVSHGLIAGVAAAGGVIILIIIGLAYYCGRQRMRARGYTRGRGMSSDDIYQHHKDMSPGATGVGMRTYSPSGTATATVVTVSPPTPSAPGLYGRDESKRSPGLSPAGSPGPPGIRPLPSTPSHGQLRQVAGAGHDDPHAQQPVDINALAMEVASVLLHTPPPRVGKRGHTQADTGQTRSHDNSDNTSQWYEPGEESDEAEGGRKSAAPPYYPVSRDTRV